MIHVTPKREREREREGERKLVEKRNVIFVVGIMTEKWINEFRSWRWIAFQNEMTKKGERERESGEIGQGAN
jgi:hypothetical protein